MSFYTQCGEAARMLLDEPGLRITTHGPPGIFTELDVIMLSARHASLRGQGYTKEDMKDVQREASQYMGMLFREKQAARYGPVEAPGGDGPDYARIAGKIIYGSIDGPTEIVTPNGTFLLMLVTNDPIKRRGRRTGTDRDDLKPWDQQEIGTASLQLTPEQREILRLQAEVDALKMKNSSLEAENRRLQQEREPARHAA